MLRKRVPDLAHRDAFYNGGLVALGAPRGRACVPRRRGHGGRRDERVRRGRQHPRHPPRRALPPAVQRRRVQPDVAAVQAATARRRRSTCVYGAEGRAHQRDDPRARSRPSATTWRRSTSCCASMRRQARRGFEITNAELAERREARRKRFAPRRAGRLLGARHLPRARARGRARATARTGGCTLMPRPRARSTSSRSVRYAEGLEEIAEFARVQARGR